MTPIVALGSVTDTLMRIAAPWRALYDDHWAVSIAVLYLHLASLLVGGGLALTTDRATVRAAGGAPADRDVQLAALRSTHRAVIGALAVTVTTGVLLFLTDVETYLPSRVYWAKMTLVALLLANGLVMTRAERAGAWGRLRATSIVSAALWLATLLAGTILSNS